MADFIGPRVLLGQTALTGVASDPFHLLILYAQDPAEVTEQYPTPRSRTNVVELLAGAESVAASKNVRRLLVCGCVGDGDQIHGANQPTGWIVLTGRRGAIYVARKNGASPIAGLPLEDVIGRCELAH